MDSTAKRARLSLKRENLSKGERTEMKKVAEIYEKALASEAFDNYYGEKRTQTRKLQSGTGTGKFPVKGVTKGPIKAGDPILRFRLRSTTVTEGKEVREALVWKPFRMVYKSPNEKNVNAKVKELRAAGFPVRILQSGKTRFVYAHQGGRGKWKYQPADVWFFKQLAMKGTALKEARADFRKAKKTSFKRKDSAKVRIKAAEKIGLADRGDYKIHKTEKGRYKIVTKKEYERRRKAKQRKAKK
jgi:hypothetical protein